MVLAGVVFFFAYNWTAMGRYLKFVLIEAGIVAGVIALTGGVESCSAAKFSF